MYRVYMEYYRTDDSGQRESERTRSLISGTAFDMQLLDPSIDLALNKAGKAEFTVPAQHPFYNYIVPMINNIEICDVSETGEETIVFFGRIANVNRGWNNQKKVTCEGALAFFNDTVQRYKKYPSASTQLIQFVQKVLERHNNQITDATRKIQLGTMNITDPDDPEHNLNTKKVYRLTNHETTLDVLTEMCIESEGGYMSVRRVNEGGEIVNLLDWVTRLDTNINQPAKFGLNLTDLNQDFDPDELYTALLPLGATYDKYTQINNPSGNPFEKEYYERSGEGPDYTYSQSNDTTVDGSKTYYEKSERYTKISWTPTGYSDAVDYVPNDDAIAKYGFIVKTKRWEDISDKEQLKSKAKKWMKTERFDKLVISCDVADLSVLKPEFDPFIVGKVVKIVSPPHGISEDDPIFLPISEVHYDLNTGKKQVTIGTQPQVTLSRITKKGNTVEKRIPDAKYDNETSDS